MNSEFVSKVLCQVIFFFIFISIFFFTYAALTEKYIVKDQLNYLIDQINKLTLSTLMVSKEIKFKNIYYNIKII